MIKNKVLNIKTIFKILKNRLKASQIPKQIFVLQNIIKRFSNIVLKNYFLKLFSKIQNFYKIIKRITLFAL